MTAATGDGGYSRDGGSRGDRRDGGYGNRQSGGCRLIVVAAVRADSTEAVSRTRPRTGGGNRAYPRPQTAQPANTQDKEAHNNVNAQRVKYRRVQRGGMKGKAHRGTPSPTANMVW